MKAIARPTRPVCAWLKKTTIYFPSVFPGSACQLPAFIPVSSSIKIGGVEAAIPGPLTRIGHPPTAVKMKLQQIHF